MASPGDRLRALHIDTLVTGPRGSDGICRVDHVCADDLRDALAGLVDDAAKHYKRRYEQDLNLCPECKSPWPCPTKRALDAVVAALGGEG